MTELLRDQEKQNIEEKVCELLLYRDSKEIQERTCVLKLFISHMLLKNRHGSLKSKTVVLFVCLGFFCKEKNIQDSWLWEKHL